MLFGKFVPDFVRSNLKGSEFNWGGMPPDPPSRHERLRVCERAFARYYHPATAAFVSSCNHVHGIMLVTLPTSPCPTFSAYASIQGLTSLHTAQSDLTKSLLIGFRVSYRILSWGGGGGGNRMVTIFA